MTDEKIINALKICGNLVDSRCKECVFHNTYNASCVVKLMENAYDLINRKNAEIEQKDIEIDILIKKKEAAYEEVAELRAENERLKSDLEFREKQLYNLVQEMEGGEK